MKRSWVFLTPPYTWSPVLTAPVKTTAHGIQKLADYKILTQYLFEDQASLKPWEEKIFKGVTNYQVLKANEENYLKSKSKDACSGLFVKIDFPPSANMYLSWRWRALDFPKKKTPDNLSNKKEDDFAARVYVIFLGANYFKSDVIEYIWDEGMPLGTIATSPFSDRIKLFVLRSGRAPESSDGWFDEERNVYEDYRTLFGKSPTKSIGAIALMSDSDNTQTSSEADFAEIKLKIKSG